MAEGKGLGNFGEANAQLGELLKIKKAQKGEGTLVEGLEEKFLQADKPVDLKAEAAKPEITELSPEEQEREFREKIDSAFFQIFTGIKKNRVLRSIFKKGEEGFDEKEKRFDAFLAELKKGYTDSCLHDIKNYSALDGWSLKKNILEFSEVEIKEVPKLTEKNKTFRKVMLDFCEKSLVEINEEIKAKINSMPEKINPKPENAVHIEDAKKKQAEEGVVGGEEIIAADATSAENKGVETKKVGDKIKLSREQFEEKYKNVLGKNLYNKEGDLLIFNAADFDEENSLVKILVQSKPKTIRLNELDSLYLTEYKLEEKKDEAKKKKDRKVEKKIEGTGDEFENIKKDIIREIGERKEKMIVLLEGDKEKNNLYSLKDYLLHNKDIIYELGKFFASLEEKLGGKKEDELFDFLEKEINASNEEIRKKFESFKPKKIEKKITKPDPVITNPEPEIVGKNGGESEKAGEVKPEVDVKGNAERIHEMELERRVENGDLKLIGEIAGGFAVDFRDGFDWKERPKDEIADSIKLETKQTIRELIMDDYRFKAVRDYIVQLAEESKKKDKKPKTEEKIREEIINKILKKIKI